MCYKIMKAICPYFKCQILLIPGQQRRHWNPEIPKHLIQWTRRLLEVRTFRGSYHDAVPGNVCLVSSSLNSSHHLSLFLSGGLSRRNRLISGVTVGVPLILCVLVALYLAQTCKKNNRYVRGFIFEIMYCPTGLSPGRCRKK